MSTYENMTYEELVKVMLDKVQPVRGGWQQGSRLEALGGAAGISQRGKRYGGSYLLPSGISDYGINRILRAVKSCLSHKY